MPDWLRSPGSPHWLADALRKEGAGDAEGLGRLNLAAASAALADTAQVVSTREAIAKERSLWLYVLRELNLPHTGISQGELSCFLITRNGHKRYWQLRVRRAKVMSDIGRAHPPYTNWARITIGLPSENLSCSKCPEVRVSRSLEHLF